MAKLEKIVTKLKEALTEVAIVEITYLSDRFPEKEFKIITENRDEALPYLRKAVEYAYDGRLELLKKSIGDRDINEFVRAAMPDVMGQLFLGGILTENEWKAFLKQNIHDGGDYDFMKWIY